MKKFLTSVAFASLFGMFNAAAVNVTVNINDPSVVSVSEITNAASNTKGTPWASVNTNNTVNVADGTVTELVINVTGDNHLTATWEPMYSSVRVNEINENNIQYFEEKGAELGGLVISLRNIGEGDQVEDGTVIYVKVSSGAGGNDNNNQETIIPVSLDIPASTPGLVETVSWLDQTITVGETNTNFTISYSSRIDYNVAMGINFKVNETTGEPVYYVGAVEASYTTAAGSAQNSAKVTFEPGSNGCFVLVPRDATSLTVYFTEGTPGKDYYDYTINVNNPAGIKVTNLTTESIIPLSGTTNKLQTADFNEVICIEANSGYSITSVTDKYGNPIPNYETRIEIKEGMEINVVVAQTEIIWKSFKVVFEPNVFESAYYTTDGETKIPFENINGENTVTYDSAVRERYSIVAIPKVSSDIYTFVNGISTGASPSTTVYYGFPVAGQTFNVYVNQPDSYSVKFEYEYRSDEGVMVTVNNYSFNWNNQGGNLIIKGAALDILTPKTVSLTLNGVPQTGELKGPETLAYAYTVNADMAFALAFVNSGSNNPGDDNNSGNEPGDDQPGDEQPGDDQPGDDQPGDDQPGDDQPGDDQPGDDQPGDDQPGDDQPGDDQPGDDQPGDDQPGDDQPGDDQPGDDQPENPDAGIDGIQADDNGELRIFDLRGNRINSTDNLLPGIYIINGKKVVVR